MKRYLFNRGKILTFMVLTATLALSVFFYKMALGFYAAKYTESAHGNYANRSGPQGFGFAVGNCVHCHEQHASIGGTASSPEPFLLFYPNNSSQNDNFCFQCHKGVGSVQYPPGGITNYTYSKNFGGGAQTDITTIYDAFNPLAGTASSHNLSDVLNHAIERNIGFSGNNNACVVCHNPHTAQKNYPVALSGLGGVNTALRRPVDYATQNTNLWGDEDLAHSGFNERMIDYDIRYTAPYYKGRLTFEPANNSTNDGSNLPNFVNFCLSQCHTRNDVYSTERGRNLIAIDWDASGDEHGRNSQPGGLGVTVAPYTQSLFNYVLSCTDCHEPHGSTNEWLLRNCVNGKDNISVPGPYRWLDFCTACHNVTAHYSPWGSTTNCNQSGVCHQHGNLF
jgi:Doubled CXXCH motif (Paired_CXXCH_1)